MLRVGGIVLCGGESKRMGKPKAWLPFAGELMLPRVVRLLSEAVDPVIVVAAPGQSLPELPPGASVVRDEEKGRGPLQGIAAGLAALEHTADAAYVSSCDVPLLEPAFVRCMVDLLGDNDICVPKVRDRIHPLAGVYRLSMLAAARRLLTAGNLRLTAILDEAATRLVSETELRAVDPDLRSLRNLNTPEDYELALFRDSAS